MAFAEKIVRHAHEVTPEDIDGLRQHGFSDEEILDIALTASSRSFYSKVMDGVGLSPSQGWLKKMEAAFGEKMMYHTMEVGRPFPR